LAWAVVEPQLAFAAGCPAQPASAKALLECETLAAQAVSADEKAELWLATGLAALDLKDFARASAAAKQANAAAQMMPGMPFAAKRSALTGASLLGAIAAAGSKDGPAAETYIAALLDQAGLNRPTIRLARQMAASGGYRGLAARADI
jgi:hypothetical protein